MKQKHTFVDPELEVIRFPALDILTLSGGEEGSGDDSDMGEILP